ncbi:ankyrin repeat domain-containing protein 7 [Oenanthe melanoleuca]|uniref:ankyrin repeat domain-containing protein 7 n=1 Tax=Oenanthe melanoleuca TaxID=2939378 RepID=UPI0024C11ADA|nr:ankyrin repeat domain-containing protein 7 [Oenanthe melanoleuca]
MAWHALQKRVRGLFSSRRQQSPSSSPSGQPCANTTGASEHKEKVQGRLHRAAACGNLAWLRRWRWYYKRVAFDLPDQQRWTSMHLASVNGHTDVIRYLAGKNCKLDVADNLKRTPLMRLQEVEEKYLNSQRCVQNLMAALEEKERETTASAMKLQDQVLEYLETVKQLEEYMERLEFENTCLVATVQQQRKTTEALQRNLQATTSPLLRLKLDLLNIQRSFHLPKDPVCRAKVP